MRTDAENIAILGIESGRFRYFDEASKTANVCLEAVKLDPSLLEYVPDNQITDGLLEIVIKSSPSSVLLISPRYLKKSHYNLAVSLKGDLVSRVPMIYWSDILFLNAVKHNGESYRYVPGGSLTEEITLEAVKQNGRTLALVPREFKTEEVCSAAVKSDPLAIVSVPEDRMSEGIAISSVENSGAILAYVLPERFKTESVCIAAVKNNRSAIVAVPKILEDFVLKEVDKTPPI